MIQPLPVQVLAQPGFEHIAASSTRTCAVGKDGSLWCWGATYQLDKAAPAKVEGLPPVTAVAMGPDHQCALAKDGSLWCWGQNSKGQLGDGTLLSKDEPTQVPGLTDVIQLSASDFGTCGVTSKQELWCAGEVVFEGDPSKMQNLAGPPIAQVALGDSYACVLLTDGRIWCWGDNQYGQRSNGKPAAGSILEVPCIHDATHLATTRQKNEDQHTCAVRGDGSVWCWGARGLESLIDPSKGTKSPTPYPIPSAKDITEVDSYGFHTCARDKTGEVFCWGRGDSGQNGTKPYPYTTEPAPLFEGLKVSQIAHGSGTDGASFHCLVKAQGGVGCWGFNIMDSLGGATPLKFTTSLVTPAGLEDATQVALGRKFGCAVKKGALWCWGQNGLGQHGNGTTDGSPTPQAVPGVDDVSKLVVFYQRTYAIRSGGALWQWGAESVDQLDKQEKGILSPQPIPALSSGVIDVQGGWTSACALRDDGSLWCWGTPSSGFEPEPAAVAGLGKITSMSLGALHWCVIDDAQKLWCWGINLQGELGNGTTGATQHVPAQVQGLPPVRSVAAGASSTCAAGTDGSVWCWGRHPGGQPGNSMTLSALLPVQVPGVSGAVQLTASEYGTCALLEDGTTRCWGASPFNELGNGVVAIQAEARPVEFPP